MKKVFTVVGVVVAAAGVVGAALYFAKKFINFSEEMKSAELDCSEEDEERKSDKEPVVDDCK